MCSFVDSLKANGDSSGFASKNLVGKTSLLLWDGPCFPPLRLQNLRGETPYFQHIFVMKFGFGPASQFDGVCWPKSTHNPTEILESPWAGLCFGSG